ncbi:hypothetical protein ABZ691_30145 [Streptomyces sp. NPDC006854]|uniref:hypothetical protein n=1 Tax=Streptomyces sp. NPDC006854 TaxID=3155115 RepID=UPI0033C63185
MSNTAESERHHAAIAASGPPAAEGPASRRKSTRRKRAAQLPDAGDEPIPGQTELPLEYRQVTLWSL